MCMGWQGTAFCLQKDATGKDVEVARLSTGNYFGEVSWLCLSHTHTW